MHPLSRFFCHLLLPLLLTLAPSLGLAAEGDEARRKDASRQGQAASATSNGAGPRLPRASNGESPAASPSGSRPSADRHQPGRTFRSARRLMRTRRLLLAALRVWELKNGIDNRW